VDANAFNYVLVQFGLAGVVIVVVLLALYRLGSDLVKLRTDLQQQVARDLLNRRFDAYGQLWAALKPLAIYSDDPLSPTKTGQLSEALSHWYFSANGGIFLTTKARDFYFALQDVLVSTAELKGWKCMRRPDDVQQTFRRFVSSLASVGGFAPDSLDHPEAIDSAQWHQVCKKIAQALRALPTSGGHEVNDVVFATVQQVSSALRSILAHELHTRLELNLPHL
jgi:hypothetical protein